MCACCLQGNRQRGEKKTHLMSPLCIRVVASLAYSTRGRIVYSASGDVGVFVFTSFVPLSCRAWQPHAQAPLDSNQQSYAKASLDSNLQSYAQASKMLGHRTAGSSVEMLGHRTASLSLELEVPLG